MPELNGKKYKYNKEGAKLYMKALKKKRKKGKEDPDPFSPGSSGVVGSPPPGGD